MVWPGNIEERNGGGKQNLDRFEVGEHLLKFGEVGWRLVGADGFETFPEIDDGGVVVGAFDGFLRDPLEDLDDDSAGGAHDDGRPVGHEALGPQWGKVVPNQFEQSLLATRTRFIAGYRYGSHETASGIGPV